MNMLKHIGHECENLREHDDAQTIDNGTDQCIDIVVENVPEVSPEPPPPSDNPRKLIKRPQSA